MATMRQREQMLAESKLQTGQTKPSPLMPQGWPAQTDAEAREYGMVQPTRAQWHLTQASNELKHAASYPIDSPEYHMHLSAHHRNAALHHEASSPPNKSLADKHVKLRDDHWRMHTASKVGS